MDTASLDKLTVIVQSSGGLGLFLLGMIVMTDSLRSLAGEAIRDALMRFTRSPLSGALTGAGATAILQSSSATTVAAVGFVGAGLMSFPSALGIIFGANIGTTITGWMVALLGFKVKLGTLVLPLILCGAIMRLFARGAWAQWGTALAGFGLIFVGITYLQQGMAGMEQVVSFQSLPADSFGGRLLLVGIGIVFTLITQSSSAGVAATLTALFSGLINFEQAAALVIGMDVGTTVTAALATVGGSVGAKRTGFSHVIYNLFTGMGALLLISPYVWLWQTLAPGALTGHAEIALVAFHSSFNILGVVAVLPFAHQFARFIERLFPEKSPPFTDKLDRGLLQQPRLALNSVFVSVRQELLALLGHVRALLDNGGEAGRLIDLRQMQEALDRTHLFLDEIHLKSGEGGDWQRLVALIHTLDHMQRLHERCDEEDYRAAVARGTPELTRLSGLLAETTERVIEAIEQQHWHAAKKCAERTAKTIHEEAGPYRQAVMADIGAGLISVPEGTDRLEAVRWLRRVSKHIARICFHLNEAAVAAGRGR